MRAPILTQKRAKVLRRAMTQPEQRLWSLLRRQQLQLRFRRQHPIGPYVLDFYCPSANLCVEVDGSSHAERVARDAARDDWLAGQGIRVLRVSVDDVMQRSAKVLADIERVAAPSTA